MIFGWYRSNGKLHLERFQEYDKFCPCDRSTMLRAAVALAALASASAFAPIASPAGLQLRAKNVARAPRSTGEAWMDERPCQALVSGEVCAAA